MLWLPITNKKEKAPAGPAGAFYLVKNAPITVPDGMWQLIPVFMKRLFETIMLSFESVTLDCAAAPRVRAGRLERKQSKVSAGGWAQ
jgi:hypothetical protein